jgi:hypothetical protein
MLCNLEKSITKTVKRRKTNNNFKKQCTNKCRVEGEYEFQSADFCQKWSPQR